MLWLAVVLLLAVVLWLAVVLLLVVVLWLAILPAVGASRGVGVSAHSCCTPAGSINAERDPRRVRTGRSAQRRSLGATPGLPLGQQLR